MEKTEKKFPNIYALELYYKDDFDALKKLVELFSYRWKVQGRVSNVLRNKLVVLLALYMKDGYNKVTKGKAAEILGVEMNSINSMNLELRQGSYLFQDKMNTRINHLHPDLLKLKDYIKDLEKGGGQPLVLFRLHRKNV